MNYALLHGKTPPPNTKDKIFQALVDQGQVGGPQKIDDAPRINTGTVATKAHRITRILAIAASLLFVASFAFHLFKMADFRQQIRQLEQETTDLIEIENAHA